MRKLIFYIFCISVLLQICLGAHAWFLWNIEHGVASQISVVIFALIAIWYKNSNNVRLKSDNVTIIILLLFSVAYVSTFSLSIPFLIGVLFRIIPLWVLLSTTEINRILLWLTNSLAIIILPGLLLNFVFMVVPSFPGPLISYNESTNYLFYNYFILLKPFYAPTESSQIRLYSVFLEPGYLGTLIAFMLYANRFNFNRRSIKILLLAEIMSFSLAGYITTFVAYIFHKYSLHISIKRFILIFISLFAIYYLSQDYNGGENKVNDLIFSRLRLDDEKGFKGNNRTGLAADYYYEQMISNGELLTGMGVERIAKINGSSDDYNKDTKINGAGYKIYFLTYGLISVVFFLLFYLFSAFRICPKNIRYSVGFFVIVALTFIQASYPDSNSWIIPYFLGLRSMNSNYLRLS